MERTINGITKIFDTFNDAIFENELERPIFTIQMPNKKGQMAWITREPVWINKETGEAKYELNVCADILHLGSKDVSEVILHEMVHLFAKLYAIEDCSKRGKHNIEFKKLAETHGLICKDEDKKLGFSHTMFSDDALEVYNLLSFEEDFLDWYATLPTEEETEKKMETKYQYVCPKCGLKFKIKFPIKNAQCGECDTELLENVIEPE